MGACSELKSSSLNTHISECRNLHNIYKPQKTTPNHNMLISGSGEISSGSRIGAKGGPTRTYNYNYVYIIYIDRGRPLIGTSGCEAAVVTAREKICPCFFMRQEAVS